MVRWWPSGSQERQTYRAVWPGDSRKHGFHVCPAVHSMLGAMCGSPSPPQQGLYIYQQRPVICATLKSGWEYPGWIKAWSVKLSPRPVCCHRELCHHLQLLFKGQRPGVVATGRGAAAPRRMGGLVAAPPFFQRGWRVRASCQFHAQTTLYFSFGTKPTQLGHSHATSGVRAGTTQNTGQ